MPAKISTKKMVAVVRMMLLGRVVAYLPRSQASVKLLKSHSCGRPKGSKPICTRDLKELTPSWYSGTRAKTSRTTSTT